MYPLGKWPLAPSACRLPERRLVLGVCCMSEKWMWFSGISWSSWKSWGSGKKVRRKVVSSWSINGVKLACKVSAMTVMVSGCFFLGLSWFFRLGLPESAYLWGLSSWCFLGLPWVCLSLRLIFLILLGEQSRLGNRLLGTPRQLTGGGLPVVFREVSKGGDP